MSAFTDQVKGNWNIVKGKLQQEWADLTDDDVSYADGKEDEFFGRIQNVTGKTKEEINKFIDDIKFD